MLPRVIALTLWLILAALIAAAILAFKFFTRH